MRVKLFTHTDLDGIGCTIVSKLAFGHENVDIEYCDYHNVNEKVRDFYAGAEKNHFDRVFITDISIGESVAEIIEYYNDDRYYPKTVLLDHHPTAISLNKYEWANVIIEDELIWVEKELHGGIHKVSGTYLLHKYLLNNRHEFKDIKILGDLIGLNYFVEMVRQYDTWEWKNVYNNQEPKQWNDLFYILGRDRFIEKIISKVHSRMEFDDTDILLLELEQNKIDKYIEEKNKELRIEEILGHKAGVVFGEQYHSELGNELCELHPEIDFVAMINLGSKKISYRAVKDNIDTGKDIAKIYGGGGHPKSSGSQMEDYISHEIIKEIFGL